MNDTGMESRQRAEQGNGQSQGGGGGGGGGGVSISLRCANKEDTAVQWEVPGSALT